MKEENSEDLNKMRLDDDFSREKGHKKTQKDKKEKVEKRSDSLPSGFVNNVYQAFKSSAPKDVRDEMNR